MAAFCALGGFAEVAVAPEFLTFPLPDSLDFAEGAGLILNYHTAWFALRLRGRLAEGETVLVHGAAGGVGTAALQVAKGLGARTIAVVSTEKGGGGPRRRCGRGRALRRAMEGRGQGALGRRVWTSCWTRSGATAFSTVCGRSVRAGGWWWWGSPAASIPEVKVNRLLLNNTEVMGPDGAHT